MSSSKRMTANPVKAARYRPGKAVPEDPSTEEEDGSGDEEPAQQPRTAPPPKATSFPSDATRIAGNLSRVNLDERRRQAVAEEAKRIESERIVRAAEEEGFETEESEEVEGSEEGSESESGSGSGSEESSSEDEAPKKLLRPTFIRKDKRKDSTTVTDARADDENWAEEGSRRKEKADAMIQEQLEKNAAAQAAGKKDWDDDEIVEVEQVDDTDDLDPETERAAWKLRELKRVKRERETIEQAEKEREEIERRRNLSKEDREAEDNEFLEGQKAERDGKGKMSYMQKYFHKGVFFQEDAKAEGLDQRDIMGSRFADQSSNRELLPEYMQIRDMTKLGRKGRTKYKDMRSEDTGRWGTLESRGTRKADGTFDERFMLDRDGGGKGASGANTTAVGERRRPPEGAPAGPRGADQAPKRKEESRRSPPRRPFSRSRSPQRLRERSYSRSPPRRERRRRRSYSYSRSPSPRRNRHEDSHPRRKRSPSPYHDRYGSDKRRRVDDS